MSVLLSGRYLSYIKYSLLCFWIIAGSSCIKEGMTDCPVEESLIYIQIATNISGDNSISADEINDVALFLFEPNGTFYKRIDVPAEQVINGIPVPIENRNISNYWVSVWGNLNDDIAHPEISDYCHLDDLSITLKEDADGYGLTPSDLFFGFKQLSFVEKVVNNTVVFEEEIQISRKNARAHITTRGLPAGGNDSDYYYLIQASNNGYDLRGNPVLKDVQLKRNGIFFGNNNDFVTPEAFNLIHTVDDSQCVTINLYKKSLTRTDALIASASADKHGKLFTLNSGETVNILIDINNEGSISFTMEVTSWNETYMWSKW